jgi:hypothetical protein
MQTLSDPLSQCAFCIAHGFGFYFGPRISDKELEILMNFLLILSYFYISAHADPMGPGSDGGAKAVVCRSHGKITKADMLDLFEERELYGLKPEPLKRSATVDQILKDSKTKLAHSVEQPEVEFFPEIDKVPSLMHQVPPDAVPKSVDDLGQGPVVDPKKLGKNCNYEQLANYTVDDDLFVNNEIWEFWKKKSDNRNQAAFYLHEGIYKYERIYGAKNSRRVRKLVAYTMSTTEFEDILAGIPANALLCKSDTDKFYVWPDPKIGAWVQFIKKEGKQVYSMTRAFVPVSLPWPPAWVNCGDIPDSCGFTGSAMVHSMFDHWELAAFGTKRVGGKTTLVTMQSDSPLQCTPYESESNSAPPSVGGDQLPKEVLSSKGISQKFVHSPTDGNKADPAVISQPAR